MDAENGIDTKEKMTTNEDTITLLSAAKNKLESGWCKCDHDNYYFAVDELGKSVAVNSPKAVKWCLLGAIYAVKGQDTLIDILRPIVKNRMQLNGDVYNVYLSLYNDLANKEDILSLFDEAIAELRK